MELKNQPVVVLIAGSKNVFLFGNYDLFPVNEGASDYYDEALVSSKSFIDGQYGAECPECIVVREKSLGAQGLWYGTVCKQCRMHQTVDPFDYITVPDGHLLGNRYYNLCRECLDALFREIFIGGEGDHYDNLCSRCLAVIVGQ